MNLVIDLHPNTLFSPPEREVFEYVGLDGHWFITRLVSYLSHGYIDLSKHPSQIEAEVYSFEEEILPDLLVEMFMEATPEDVDEGYIRFLDEYLEENGLMITMMAKTVLNPLLDILENVHPPTYASSPNILNHLQGYSLVDSHAGALHFNFLKDPR